MARLSDLRRVIARRRLASLPIRGGGPGANNVQSGRPRIVGMAADAVLRYSGMYYPSVYYKRKAVVDMTYSHQ